MRATVYGRITGPAIAIAGVWDPLVPAHRSLFDQLCCQAGQSSRSSLAVLIDPDPALVARGRAKWPVYDDLPTRTHRLLDSGIDGVLHLRFFWKDLSAAAAEFFSMVTAHVAIEEFWLGAHQTLGRGCEGSQQAIEQLAEQYGIRLRRLPIVTLCPAGFDVRQSLAAGRVTEVAGLIGHPPVRSRPNSGSLRLAWHPGRYRVLPLDSPTATAKGSPVEVDLVPTAHGLSRLDWPERSIKYLAFVAGPGDQV